MNVVTPHALAERLLEEGAKAWEPEVWEQMTAHPERSRRHTVGEAQRCLALANLANAVYPRRVLEVGIGYLGITTTLREVFDDEITIAAIEHPKRSSLNRPGFREAVDAQRVELVPCDLLDEDIPFDGLFDAVFFCDVIEHLPVTRVPEVVAKLGSKVRPGGRLVMSSTNLSALIRVVSLAFGRGNILDPPFPLPYAGNTYGHIRLYGRYDVEIILDRVGLDLVEWKYLNWERDFLDRDTPGRRLAYLMQGIAPRLARHLSTSWICSATPKEGTR